MVLSLVVGAAGRLRADILISGDWSSYPTDPTQFQVNYTMELDGGGPVQHFEVASYDYGNTVAANAPAFTNNFNIGSSSDSKGTLQIDTHSYMRLVDNIDNGNRGGVGVQTSPVTWTGNPTGAEALYLWNLVIQPDVTIDLNGLQLYYENGPSGGVGPDPSVWSTDLAIWKAQGDVFIGGEPILIPMVQATVVPEPSRLVTVGTTLAGLSAFAWIRRRRTVVGPQR
jgi:hypothetical protein